MRRDAVPSPSSGTLPSNTGPRRTQQPSIRSGQTKGPNSAILTRDVREHPTFRSQPTRFQRIPSLPQQDKAQSTPRGRERPTFLQGKNPYGRILDKIEHPYRETQPSPPSQLGSSIKGRPRTSGSFKFTSRPTPPPQLEQTISRASSPTTRPLHQTQPPRALSVKDAKSFFESKISEARQAPPLLPRKTATIAKGATTVLKLKTEGSQPVLHEKSREEQARSEPRPNRPTNSPTIQKVSDLSSYSPEPPTEPSERFNAEQRGYFARSVLEPAGPTLVVRTTAGVEVEDPPSSRRRSTNVFIEPRRSVQPLGGLQCAVVQRNNLDALSNAARIAIEESKRSTLLSNSDGTVRRRSTRKSLSNAEPHKDTTPGNFKSSNAQRTQTNLGIRRTATSRCDSQNTPVEPGRDHTHRPGTERQVNNTEALIGYMRQKSSIIPIVRDDDANESIQRSRRKSVISKPQSMDDRIETYVHNFGEPIESNRNLEELAAKGFSHDGSSSHNSQSRRSSAPAPIHNSNVGVEEGYYSIEVPEHVDWRGAYGRRKTKDFGFPGARIKPRSTFRQYNGPLQDPSNWIKRVCGHFSAISDVEPREEASNRPCNQCSETPLPVGPPIVKPRRTRKRAATDSSTASSASSRNSEKHSRKRRQHHSDCIPAEKCGDTFAQDLGYIIDSILEEHQSTLQNVINNIKNSQPNLVQLRRVSEDLVQRCQSGGVCSKPCHTVCRRPGEYPLACSHIYQPCQPCQPVQQACEWQPPCPYVPPKAAEKLNVGATGQLGPTVNDSRSSLHESIKSTPELVDLVKSAADDFGVDLDQGPTAKDDEEFQNAPFERSPRRSVVSRRSTVLEPVEEKAEEEKHDNEDTWLQKTRRQLTELSEARSQLMDELDTIAEDLGVHLDDRRRSSPEIDPVQRVLSKMSTGLSRRSTRLRNKSIDSVADEAPRMLAREINEQRLSRVLTRIQTQSRRVSAVSQGLTDIEAIPVGEIQGWLETAQFELPAAIESITNVLDTLPAIGEPGQELEYEGLPREQSGFEEGLQYDEEPEAERYEEQGYGYQDYSETPRRRSRAYTEPILMLQDRVADLERRLRAESVQPDSILGGYSEEEGTPEVERTTTQPVEFVPPTMRMADEEPRGDKGEPYAALSRKSTQPMIEDVEGLSSGQESAIGVGFQSRRSTFIESRKPSLQTKGTQSYATESDFEEQDIPPHGLQQKIADTELTFEGEPNSRQLTQRKPSLPRAPTIPEDVLSQLPEFNATSRRSTANPSRQPTNQEPNPPVPGAFEESPLFEYEESQHDPELEAVTEEEDIDFQPPYLRKATGLESDQEEEDFQAPVERIRRVSTQKSTKPPSPALEEIVDESNVSRIATRKMTHRPTMPPEIERPNISRVTTRQPTRKATLLPDPEDEDFQPPLMRMARSMTQAAIPSLEPDAEDLPQALTHQRSRRKTINDVYELPTESPPVFRSRTESIMPWSKAVTEALVDNSTPQGAPPEEYEEESVPPEPVMRKSSTRQSTISTSPPDPEPVSRRVTSRHPTERIVEPEVETGSTEHTSSSIPELVSRKVTTRRPTERNLSPEPIEDPPSPDPVMRKEATSTKFTQRSLSTRTEVEDVGKLEPVQRKATTWRSNESTTSSDQESVIRKITTRGLTESSHSPGPVVHRATRRRTEPLVRPPAPPSPPSSESEAPAIPALHMTDVSPRVNTCKSTVPRQETFSRQSSYPERIALPQSDSSSASERSSDRKDTADSPPVASDTALEKDARFVPPTMRMHQASTVFDPEVESEPNLTPVVEHQPSQSRRQTTTYRQATAPVSRKPTEVQRANTMPLESSPTVASTLLLGQPTIAERRATLEKTLTFPSRQSTMLVEAADNSRFSSRRSTNFERQSPVLRRTATGEPISLPTRRRTGLGDVIPSLTRQSTRRGTEVEEPTMVRRIATRQPTRRSTESKPDLEPEPELVDVRRDMEAGGPSQDEDPPVMTVRRDRQRTGFSRQPTAVKNEPPGVQSIDLPDPSRAPTRMPTQVNPRSDEAVAGSESLSSEYSQANPPSEPPTPYRISRQATRMPTLPPEEPNVPRRSTRRLSENRRGIVQRNAEPEPEPEPEVNLVSSVSRQPSVLDEPLAPLDVYHASPTPDQAQEEEPTRIPSRTPTRQDSMRSRRVSEAEEATLEEAPRKPSRTLTRRDSRRSRRTSTVDDVQPENKVVRIQDEPSAAYSPLHTPNLSSRQPSISTLERQPVMFTDPDDIAPDTPLAAQPLSRIAERQPTLPTEEIPEQEPGRFDRPPTADLSRDPESLAPRQEGIITDDELKPEPLSKRRTSGLPRILTVPVERQKQPSSVAPGIVAPPVQNTMQDMKKTASSGALPKSRNHGQVSLGKQHPSAPAYPIRDTPSWTRPNTSTPPPKPKLDVSKAKAKRAIFGWGAKPREEPRAVSRAVREPSPGRTPIQKQPATRTPEPIDDRGGDHPFRAAAPGPVPGTSWGTLQRPRGYRTTPGQEPVYPSYAGTGGPQPPIYNPVRRDDYYPRRAGPDFAQKDHYFPRLQPPERQDSYTRPRVAPVRRDVYSQQPRRYDYPPPSYRQPPPRQGYAPRYEANPPAIRSQAPEPSRYQPQSYQSLRDQETAPPQRQAPSSPRRAQAHEEPPRKKPIPQDEGKSRPVRRDAQCDSEAQVPPQREARRLSTSGATGQDEIEGPSQATSITPKCSQEPAAKEGRGSSAGRGKTSGQGPEAEKNTKKEGSRNTTSDHRTQDDRDFDDARRHSINSTSPERSRPSIDATRPTTSRATPSQPILSPAGGVRRSSAQDQIRRRSSAQRSGEHTRDTPANSTRTGALQDSTAEAEDPSRALTGQDASRRVSNTREDPTRPRADLKAAEAHESGSRRPSTAFERKQTASRRSSTSGASERPAPVSRTATAPARTHSLGIAQRKGIATSAPTLAAQSEVSDERVSAGKGSEEEGVRGPRETLSRTPTAGPRDEQNSSRTQTARENTSTAGKPLGPAQHGDERRTSASNNPRHRSTAIPNLNRNDSVVTPKTAPPPPVATRQRSWTWGRGNKSASPPRKTAAGGRGASPGKDKDTTANGDVGGKTQAEGDGQKVVAGKVGARIAQGSSGLRGRWGWGWGRG